VFYVKHTLHMQSNLRELRTKANLSQADLADRLGVSRQTVNAIETQRYDPSLELAIQIARYFKTTVEEVFHVD
jgi:putative transcriptional regulator